MKDLKEFDKFIARQAFALLEYGDKSSGAMVGLYRHAWNAALKMVYYKGVLEGTLAGDLIEGELDGNL